jgi:hypothetical protein
LHIAQGLSAVFVRRVALPQSLQRHEGFGVVNGGGNKGTVEFRGGEKRAQLVSPRRGVAPAGQSPSAEPGGACAGDGLEDHRANASYGPSPDALPCPVARYRRQRGSPVSPTDAELPASSSDCGSFSNCTHRGGSGTGWVVPLPTGQFRAGHRQKTQVPSTPGQSGARLCLKTRRRCRALGGEHKSNSCLTLNAFTFARKSAFPVPPPGQ